MRWASPAYTLSSAHNSPGAIWLSVIAIYALSVPLVLGLRLDKTGSGDLAVLGPAMIHGKRPQGMEHPRIR